MLSILLSFWSLTRKIVALLSVPSELAGLRIVHPNYEYDIRLCSLI